MLRITKNKDEIIVREIPVAYWIDSILVGAILFFCSFLVLLSMRQLSNWPLSLAGIISFAVFLLYLSKGPATTTKINKQGKIISVRKQNFIKYNFKVYSFNEVADLIYINKISDFPNTNYQIILPLNRGVEIKLSTQIRTNELEYFDAVNLMNKYIFDSPKQLP